MKLDIVINSNNVIVRKNLNIIKKDYLSKIKEAQMLGEDDQVLQLQEEWKQIKLKYKTID